MSPGSSRPAADDHARDERRSSRPAASGCSAARLVDRRRPTRARRPSAARRRRADVRPRTKFGSRGAWPAPGTPSCGCRRAIPRAVAPGCRRARRSRRRRPRTDHPGAPPAGDPRRPVRRSTVPDVRSRLARRRAPSARAGSCRRSSDAQWRLTLRRAAFHAPQVPAIRSASASVSRRRSSAARRSPPRGRRRCRGAAGSRRRPAGRSRRRSRSGPARTAARRAPRCRTRRCSRRNRSSSRKTAMSARRPTPSEPSSSSRRIASPACDVDASTMSGTDQPTWRNFDIVVSMSKTGPSTQRRCRSVEIVSGAKPWSAARRYDRPRERAAAVADVEDDATLLGVADLRQQRLAAAEDEAAVVGDEGVRDDVARPQLAAGSGAGRRRRRRGT